MQDNTFVTSLDTSKSWGVQGVRRGNYAGLVCVYLADYVLPIDLLAPIVMPNRIGDGGQFPLAFIENQGSGGCDITHEVPVATYAVTEQGPVRSYGISFTLVVP